MTPLELSRADFRKFVELVASDVEMTTGFRATALNSIHKLARSGDLAAWKRIEQLTQDKNPTISGNARVYLKGLSNENDINFH